MPPKKPQSDFLFLCKEGPFPSARILSSSRQAIAASPVPGPGFGLERRSWFQKEVDFEVLPERLGQGIGFVFFAPRNGLSDLRLGCGSRVPGLGKNVDPI